VTVKAAGGTMTAEIPALMDAVVESAALPAAATSSRRNEVSS